jgi:hypothetical protein
MSIPDIMQSCFQDAGVAVAFDQNAALGTINRAVVILLQRP